VSQPALSAQVRKLEGYLGARIFERSRNGVLMTKPGAALVERARLVLTEANTLLAVARDSAAPLAGPFRLGSIPTVGPHFLPHLLKTFRHSFPSTQLVLSEKRTNELLAIAARRRARCRDRLRTGAGPRADGARAVL
jgi:LysR family hydrogen peroxide-inducible transcriptional activator